MESVKISINNFFRWFTETDTQAEDNEWVSKMIELKCKKKLVGSITGGYVDSTTEDIIKFLDYKNILVDITTNILNEIYFLVFNFQGYVFMFDSQSSNMRETIDLDLKIY